MDSTSVVVVRHLSPSGTVDGHHHHIRPDGLSATLTLINFFKSMLGPGCLTAPMAFKQAGLWSGLVLVSVLGYLSTFSMHQLVHAAQYLCKRKRIHAGLSYGSLASEACGESFPAVARYALVAKRIVNYSIFALQMGVCCVQYDFIAVHLQELFPLGDPTPPHSPRFNYWTLLIALPMLILVNLARDNLRRIAVLSTVGNVCMLVSFAFIYMNILIPPFHTSELPAFNSPIGLIQASGAILYAFEGQTVVLPMENKLAHPSEMVSNFGVISTGMSLVSIVLAAMGFLGYAKYGQGIRGSLTLNLPETPLFLVVKATFIVVPFVNYVLMQYVVAEEVVPYLKSYFHHHGHQRLLEGQQQEGVNSGGGGGGEETMAEQVTNETGGLVQAGGENEVIDAVENEEQRPTRTNLSDWHELGVELAFRTATILLTLAVSILVPNIDQIIPLVGFSAGMLLAFVFPATIDTLLFLPPLMATSREVGGGEEETSEEAAAVLPATAAASANKWKIAWKLARNAGFILVGVVGGIAGIVFTVRDIYEAHV